MEKDELEKAPVIEAYKAGVDRILLRENPRRTPADRLRRLQAMYDFWKAARMA
ncbi:MAG: hypothetical protein HYY25_10445 [Candidatus Wallbacteria bacterium]|nr:hypothetical protein [Candidatus Wallbacteria bacterium]